MPHTNPLRLDVEELVGPDTVNTMPEATLAPFRDHGVVRPRAILNGVEEAAAVLAALPEHGIDLTAVAAGLLDDGLAAFEADLAALPATPEGMRAEDAPPAHRDGRPVAAASGVLSQEELF